MVETKGKTDCHENIFNTMFFEHNQIVWSYHYIHNENKQPTIVIICNKLHL